MFLTPSVILSLGPGRLVRVFGFVAIFLLMVLVLTLLFEQPAHAAGTAILDQLRPALGDVAAIVITALLAWAAQRFKAWTGVEIEAKHREALQSALANGARIAVQGGDLRMAIDYVLGSVPDALAHFGADDKGRVQDLLEPHIARARSAG